jgi:hypothetical protein
LLTSLENINPIKEPNVKIEPFCDKPVLMSAITVDKKTGAFKIALFLCWRHQVTSTMTTGHGKSETIHKLMAQRSASSSSKKVKVTEVFAEGFNMVLLWCTMWKPDDKDKQQSIAEEEGKKGDSPGLNEFAKALVAVFLAMQCMKDWQTKECSDNFLVLGPNCCKVKLLQVS